MVSYVQLGPLTVSRFILGSNPFSGFSHQSPAADLEMKRYYTIERIKQTMCEAEELGVNTLIARTDFHVMRLLLEYWDQGGQIQWFAQTCPEVGDHVTCINRAASGGAKACHIHGGVMDYLLAQERLNEIPPMIDLIHQKGMLAGIAGHHPEVFLWAEEVHLQVDYYMCSYYNSAHRDQRPEHVPGMEEWFLEEDRAIMAQVIQTLSKPVVHYKIMAAGRNDPREAFIFAARHMRPVDMVCVGIYSKGAPHMLRQDVELLEAALAGQQQPAAQG